MTTKGPIRPCKLPLDTSTLSIKPFDKKSENAPAAFVKRTDPKTGVEQVPLMQVGEIKIVSGGIPKQHPIYAPTPDKQEHMDIALDPSQPNCVILENAMTELDEYFSSTEIKKKIFGKKYKRYIYSSIVKRPKEVSDSDEDDESAKPKDDKKVRLNKVRVKFDFIAEGDVRINHTKVSKLTPIPGESRQMEEKLVVESVDDLMKAIPFGSTIKAIIKISKIWKMGEKYGVGLKFVNIRCKPSNHNKLDNDDVDYLSDEDDDEIIAKPSASPPKSDKKGNKKGSDKNDKKKGKNKAKNDKSSSDGEDESSESSEPPASKKGKKPAKNDDSSSDGDDESSEPSEPVPKHKDTKKNTKGTKKHTVTKDHSDSDSDSDSEPAPKKKNAKKNAVVKNHSESDSGSDSESSEDRSSTKKTKTPDSDSESESSEKQPPKKTKKSKAKEAPPKKTKKSKAKEASDSDVSEEIIAAKPKKGKKKSK